MLLKLSYYQKMKEAFLIVYVINEHWICLKYVKPQLNSKFPNSLNMQKWLVFEA